MDSAWIASPIWGIIKHCLSGIAKQQFFFRIKIIAVTAACNVPARGDMSLSKPAAAVVVPEVKAHRARGKSAACRIPGNLIGPDGNVFLHQPLVGVKRVLRAAGYGYSG